MSRSKVKGKKRLSAKARAKQQKFAVPDKKGSVVNRHTPPTLSAAITHDNGATSKPSADQPDWPRPSIKFVYPRNSASASADPVVFNFRKRSKVEGLDATASNIKRNTDHDEVFNQLSDQVKNEETIESILVGKRSSSGKASSNKSKASAGMKDQNFAESDAGEGEVSRKASLSRKLSGVSVQDAINDKSGCRPRANSTDGELNLPRRGLCDEGMVLGSHKWPSSWRQRAPKGLVNLGNTCFLNATLQCLAYIPPLCQCLTALEPRTGKLLQGQRITELLKRLFRQVHDLDAGKSTVVSPGAIAPRPIVKAVPTLGSVGSRNGYKFRPGRQEDAHEFLVHLLDAMQDGELRAAGINQHLRGWRDRLPIPRLDETTFVHRVFGGYLRSQVRCTKCGYCSNTYDPFLDLSLEVSKKSSNSISSAFQEFARKETLDRDNKWRCSGCRKDVCATKQLTVFRPPLSLCIQLKRFAFSNGIGFGSGGFSGYPKGIRLMGMGGGGSKISKRIEFPSRLKLPLSDGRKCEYALTGVVVHLGGSATSGHYTSYVKKPGGEGSSKWCHMDDSFVEPVSESTVLKQKDAYVLFYCRTEVKLELPTPPPRASMTTEEAKELNAVRSKMRSRSTSLSREPPSLAVHEAEAINKTKIPIAKLVEENSHERKEKPELNKATEMEIVNHSPSKGKPNKIEDDSKTSAAANSSEDAATSFQSKLQHRTQSNLKPAISVTSMLQKKKTRVVLDRGASHGKLEVMIGPRYKMKKAWKPKASAVHTPDDNLELLGTRSVSKWGVDDVAKASQASRKQVIQKIEKEERVRKRSMHLDRWDSSLDQGKTKKVKVLVEEPTLSYDSKNNPFHRIQSGMQKMNRGRAKGSRNQEKKGGFLQKKGKMKSSFKTR